MTCGDCRCGSDPAYTEYDTVATELLRDSLGRVAGLQLRTTTSKLTEWDANADLAFEELLNWIAQNRDELLAVAKGRHVWGHYRYADRNYYEYDADRLVSETAEEIGDAINYFTRRRVLRESA
jgi:hypothetical protein